MFPKKFVVAGILLVVVAVVIMISVGVWLGSAISGGSSSKAVASPYSAVYLSNGDMYFGVLSWFPKPRLSNVWLLQRQVDKDNQPQISVGQFTKAFWAPMDELSLNPKEIIWWVRLRSDSQLAKAMNNPPADQQQQQPPAETSAPKNSQPAK
ncbi:MAG: hypothetical protein Q7K44_01065 [Candidatus Liptonbacteria bacterium]|nr:hypothetical protein [Candidatus Liptonbacteria bacterium]